MRGQFVFLHIKRRRWTDKNTGQIVKRDWDLVTRWTRFREYSLLYQKKLIDTKDTNCHTIGYFFGDNGKKNGKTISRIYERLSRMETINSFW